jgi:hypothetical protein
MGKSYRRPYAAVTGCRSAAQDKLVARRCWRRAQEHALRNFTDWDSFLIPERYEANFNDVWTWGRDGNQTLRSLGHNDFNLYYRTSYLVVSSLEKLIQRHKNSLARKIQWITELGRK